MAELSLFGDSFLSASYDLLDRRDCLSRFEAPDGASERQRLSEPAGSLASENSNPGN